MDLLIRRGSVIDGSGSPAEAADICISGDRIVFVRDAKGRDRGNSLHHAARASGVRVTANQYPYTASGTSVVAALVPRWAEADGRDALLKRIQDSAIRQQLVADMTTNLQRHGGADKMLICSAAGKQIVGKTLAEIARTRNESAIDAALQIVKAGDAGVASFNMRTWRAAGKFFWIKPRDISVI